MALNIDIAGMIVQSRIRPMRFPLIERGPLQQVKGIVVHQTNAATAGATFASYRKANAKGAHFLIDKDGTLYQTASVTQTKYHIGSIRPRCLDEMTCSPKTYAGVARGAPTHRIEVRKSWPARYPVNTEAIGIELVGRASLPPNFVPPRRNPPRTAEQLLAEFGVYETPTTLQNISLRWLVDELIGSMKISRTEVFRHPVVSWKNETEARGAAW